MRLARLIPRSALLIKIMMVALLGAGLSAGLVAPAQAAPGDSVCGINVDGRSGQYLCKYPPSYVFYDSRWHVFVVGTDDAVWHIWQTSVNGPWSNWTSLGGVARSSVGYYAYSQSGAKVLRINVTGTTGRRYCKWYNLPSNPGRWTPGQTTWSLC